MAASRSGFVCMINEQALAYRLFPLLAPKKRERSSEPSGLLTALMTYAQLLVCRLLLPFAPKKGLPSVAREEAQR